MNHRTWDVVLHLDSFLNFYHASNPVAGLQQLEDLGVLTLSIETPRNGRTSYSGSPLVLLLDVADRESGARKHLALDLYDRSDRFSKEQLDRCDVYFKRSFHADDIAQLPLELGSKVRPFGLNYACRYKASRTMLPLAGDYVSRLGRAALKGPKRLANELHQLQLRGFLRSPSLRGFEQPPSSTRRTGILFQTRLWGPDEVGAGESWEDINADRVALVRMLKRSFPGRFLGGVMPSAFAKKHYPELVTEAPSERRDFITWSRDCSVGIYSRGLNHSHAFKLAEYLASSKCIVSCPIRNSLPNPLVRGLHYFQFEDAELCAAHCEMLLLNKKLAADMQAANWEYYNSDVQPSARMKRLLRDAFLTPDGECNQTVLSSSQ